MVLLILSCSYWNYGTLNLVMFLLELLRVHLNYCVAVLMTKDLFIYLFCLLTKFNTSHIHVIVLDIS